MKLDVTYLEFISRQQLRLLSTIELGMRNHEWVPLQTIINLSKLRKGQTYTTLKKLLKNKFITHTGRNCMQQKKYYIIDDGYRLTYLGYDYLALNTLFKRKVINKIVGKIGVGKQSDVYCCLNNQGEKVVLKLTRLGRNSFRSIKRNREYIQHRTNYNWLYLSRLSSIRQFMFMQLLYNNGFKTPKPIESNRHAIVMSMIQGYTLCHVQKVYSSVEIQKLFQMSLELVTKFASYGLIHGDFNEFNLITNDQGTELTVIDFPQCMSTHHPNAENYFDRDVQCIYNYFQKMSAKVKDNGEGKFDVSEYPMPSLDKIENVKRLDKQMKAKGHITLNQQKLLQQYRIQQSQQNQMEQEQNQFQNNLQNQQYNLEQSEYQNKQQKIQKLILEKYIQDEQQIQNNDEESRKLSEEDQQLQQIMDKMNQVGSCQQKEKEDEKEQKQEQEQRQEETQQKYELTPYQERIQLKQKKIEQRKKKKQTQNSSQYIKQALKRQQKYRNINKKGNYGQKKNQKNLIQIRQVVSDNK